MRIGAVRRIKAPIREDPVELYPLNAPSSLDRLTYASVQSAFMPELTSEQLAELLAQLDEVVQKAQALSVQNAASFADEARGCGPASGHQRRRGALGRQRVSFQTVPHA